MHRLTGAADLTPGSSREVIIAGKCLAIFNVDGRFYSIDGICPHAGGSLAEGDLAGEVVCCPWHGAEFNVRTGELLAPPATAAVQTYPVEVDGKDLLVQLD